jgi:hypothetical protein
MNTKQAMVIGLFLIVASALIALGPRFACAQVRNEPDKLRPDQETGRYQLGTGKYNPHENDSPMVLYILDTKTGRIARQHEHLPNDFRELKVEIAEKRSEK